MANTTIPPKNNVKPGTSPSAAGWKAFGEHLITIFVYNILLAAIVFVGNIQNQSTPNWSLLIVSLVAQGFLAILDSFKQYMLAYNPAVAEVANEVETAIKARVPSVNMPASLQADAQTFNQAQAQQAANALLSQYGQPAQYGQPVANAQASASAAQPTQYTNVNQVPPSASTPASASPSTVDTLPLIHAVQAPTPAGQ